MTPARAWQLPNMHPPETQGLKQVKSKRYAAVSCPCLKGLVMGMRTNERIRIPCSQRVKWDPASETPFLHVTISYHLKITMQLLCFELLCHQLRRSFSNGFSSKHVQLKSASSDFIITQEILEIVTMDKCCPARPWSLEIPKQLTAGTSSSHDVTSESPLQHVVAHVSNPSTKNRITVFCASKKTSAK